MGLKSLFIVSDENPDDKPENKKVETKTTTKFPNETTSFPIEEPSSGSTVSSWFGSSTPAPKVETFTPTFSNEPNGATVDQLEKANSQYQQGFDSLNQDGYDFYEFYQAIISADAVNNGQMYKMAFTMAVAMEKTITKDKLVGQSEFYSSEIEKVFQDFVNKGNAKKQSIIEEKNHETQALSGELDLMEQQLEALKTQIADRRNKLSVIDSKYGPKLIEIEGKLIANNIAKTNLVGKIESVKQGIKNNL